ncbi:hypothetical protein BUL40_11535 [Croceivirga radicis]|uniref:Pyridoxamine 5'-phosphate oxidase Alr4036 family FMN-binding domain-containing protein n=1 Tax=Croceivirga radicis TaxID=1929488 RepID=A0A1V6LQB6_9FLAO|nr:pyridoxamine 5'-phosphate oxidase family protein [Croceivirga radicis]OQD42390.1 hypothetical protein BUL40_11535 [Croceivirga radicis]
MSNIYLAEIKREFKSALDNHGHPFNYFVCSSIEGSTPKQRTVVLRGFKSEYKPIFYTDKRSAKVEQLRNNSAISALFYHPDKKLQLVFTGNAKIITDTKALHNVWTSLSDNAKKDYTTQKAPGSSKEPNEIVDYLSNRNFFCQIEIETERIEYLKLEKPQHQRILFTKQDWWEEQFLIP